ncbi:MAG: hypothetical protein J7L14_03555 [Candidatus Diapherotrites archaeon]|nr:hypothetical protein [Candidatus Diapherotrites archaeon]
MHELRGLLGYETVKERMEKGMKKCIVCGKEHNNATFYCDDCLEKMDKWRRAEG